MKSYKKLFQESKLKNVVIPPYMVKFYYNNQAITQILKPIKKVRTNSHPIITDEPNKIHLCKNETY